MHRQTLNRQLRRAIKGQLQHANGRKSKFGSNATLNTPQRAAKLRRLAASNRNAARQICRLTKAVERVAERQGHLAEGGLHETLVNIVEEKNAEVEADYKEGSYLCVYNKAHPKH